jgi:hypothetical protein
MDSTEVSDVAEEKYLYLTTIGRKTGNSHMVELWFAVAMEKIYLSHEGAYTDWMKNILKDNTVEFKIGSRRLKGKAHIYREGTGFEIGKHALYRKYYGEASNDVVDDWFSESTVIEINLE